MTFFYSAIAILLFSSIAVVNRFSVLFFNQNFETIQSSYVGSEYQQIDRFFLRLLYDGRDYGEKDQVCINLKKELNFSGFVKSKRFEYILSGLTNSRHQDLVNSCILSDGFHRVLIKKTSNLPIQYSLNSCILKRQEICTFEIGDL